MIATFMGSKTWWFFIDNNALVRRHLYILSVADQQI